MSQFPPPVRRAGPGCRDFLGQMRPFGRGFRGYCLPPRPAASSGVPPRDTSTLRFSVVPVAATGRYNRYARPPSQRLPMCGRFTLYAPADQVAEAFAVAVPELSPRYNIAP